MQVRLEVCATLSLGELPCRARASRVCSPWPRREFALTPALLCGPIFVALSGGPARITALFSSYVILAQLWGECAPCGMCRDRIKERVPLLELGGARRALRVCFIFHAVVNTAVWWGVFWGGLGVGGGARARVRNVRCILSLGAGGGVGSLFIAVHS